MRSGHPPVVSQSLAALYLPAQLLLTSWPAFSLPCLAQIKRLMQLPKLSTPPSDFLRSMEAYLADAPRPLPADGDVPLPTKVRRGLRWTNCCCFCEGGPLHCVMDHLPAGSCLYSTAAFSYSLCSTPNPLAVCWCVAAADAFAEGCAAAQRQASAEQQVERPGSRRRGCSSRCRHGVARADGSCVQFWHWPGGHQRANFCCQQGRSCWHGPGS